MSAADDVHVLRLQPGPPERVPLRGLYLHSPCAPPADRARTFVYANYISSLDGRTSLPDPLTQRSTVPRALANGRDWRLFQELSACADAVVVTGSHVRQLPGEITGRSFPVSARPPYADLHAWRVAQGLPPQPAVVIVSASLQLPDLSELSASGRPVYVAAGRAADPRRVARLEGEGVRVLLAGSGARVEGGRLIDALAREQLCNIAMVSGGELLHTLAIDDVLDRLYLTVSCRLLGGFAFDTLVTGETLEGAPRFNLRALHYDANAGSEGAEQLFAIFDAVRSD